MPDRYDLIIIGTGAGGGTLLHRLAPSGKRILVLERGGFLPRERENWDPGAVNHAGRYVTQEKWQDKDGNAFSPYTHYWVGGNTKVYGAALLRMRQDDFGELRHYDGVSPAWPLTYDDLEPYYAQAERMYSVHGDRGSDPHEPRSSSPFPFPALRHEPRMQEVFNALHARGYKPFPIPLGVRLPSDRATPAPELRLSLFDGYPDLTEAKADAHVVGVQPSLTCDNVTLLTDAFVERLTTDPTGREVTGVLARRNGRNEWFQADTVVVACGAINSAALFLRSRSEVHPGGLANSSGLVGRNYMCHNNATFVAVTDQENPSQFQKTFGLTDFYRSAPDSDLPLGTIQLMGKVDAKSLGLMAKAVLPDVDPNWLAAHTLDFFLTAEDLPRAENRVALADDGSIRLIHHRTNLEAYRRLRAKAEQMLVDIGLTYKGGKPVILGDLLGVSGVSHQCGTLRFGVDPATSVLNLDCRAHDVDNLYVADASFFPSSGAVNPSLTIMANALRVADILLGSTCHRLRPSSGEVGANNRTRPHASATPP